jgi:hypothetical protein
LHRWQCDSDAAFVFKQRDRIEMQLAGTGPAASYRYVVAARARGAFEQPARKDRIFE